jgi:hypothetical protein
VRPIVILVAASLALVACASTYHPEYHPVTVSNVAYPVVVNNGGSPSERSPTFIVPGVPVVAPPATVLAPAPAEQPPAGFFAHE